MNQVSDKTTEATLVRQVVPKTLAELFETFRTRLMLELETVMPAIVIEYDRNTHIALVQPLMQRVDVEQNKLIIPQIKVEVRRIYSGGFLIDVPLHPNDTGWVIASERDTSTIKANNPNELGQFMGTDAPPTGVAHSYVHGYFIPDRWGDAYMPKMEADKSHVTDFDDIYAPPPKPEVDEPTYVAKQAVKVDTFYGDIEKSPRQFFTQYKTPGKDTAVQRAKDDLAEIPQPDGAGGLIPPQIGGPLAREFNTDYDRLVIQSKDKKQRISMGQKDIKVYSSNLIYVNSQKDIIAYARENVDVHVGEKIDGADTSQGMVNVYSNQNIKVTCASMKKDGKIDVCSNGSLNVHSPEVVIDGDAPNPDDPQQMPRIDEMAKTETLATNIKVHANKVNISCTTKPDGNGKAGTGVVNVNAEKVANIHAPVLNIDGGMPNAAKPASGEPIAGTPGTVNILGNVNITGAVKVDGAGTVLATTEVTAKTIALTAHVHTGCQGGTTGAPVG